MNVTRRKINSGGVEKALVATPAFLPGSGEKDVSRKRGWGKYLLD
jgi:hypothetical protein